MTKWICILALAASRAWAGLEIMCTTADLGALAREIGGKEAQVSVICAVDRDPHYLEAKPSYMLKASKADLVVANGLELEQGWLPSILRGGRNPKVLPGAPGYFEAGSLIAPLELPKGGLSRAEGDVHPGGNPHFMLDPIRAGAVAEGLAARMGELDNAHAGLFHQRAAALKRRLEAKAAAWKLRVAKSGVKLAFTYHKTLVYFFDRFGLENAGNLEPKPGIPPTAGHLMDLARVAKERGVALCLVEHYFDKGAAGKLKSEVPSLRVETAVVMGSELDATYENLVKLVEGQ